MKTGVRERLARGDRLWIVGAVFRIGERVYFGGRNLGRKNVGARLGRALRLCSGTVAGLKTPDAGHRLYSSHQRVDRRFGYVPAVVVRRT